MQDNEQAKAGQLNDLILWVQVQPYGCGNSSAWCGNAELELCFLDVTAHSLLSNPKVLGDLAGPLPPVRGRAIRKVPAPSTPRPSEFARARCVSGTEEKQLAILVLD
jgi:hypothetical protein